MSFLPILLQNGESEDVCKAVEKAAQCVKNRDEERLYLLYPDTIEDEKRFLEYKKSLYEIAEENERELIEIVLPSQGRLLPAMELLAKLLNKEVEETSLPLFFGYDPENEETGLFAVEGVWKMRK